MTEELKNLLEKLKDFDQVVVTDPHRSGTTFVCKAQADSLGYKAKTEEGFGNDFVRLYNDTISSHKLNRPSVYQVPLLFAYVHNLEEHVAVVCIRRPIEEIVASEIRLNWSQIEQDNRKREGFNKVELNKYFATYNIHERPPGELSFNNEKKNQELAKAIKDNEPDWKNWHKETLSEVKYKIWDKYQKPLIKNVFEINHSDFEGHPMWVVKEERKDFGPRQTEIE